MKFPHAWCPAERESATVVVQMCLEVASYMEMMLQSPPVYFRERYLLEGWALLSGFVLERRNKNTYCISGWRGNGKEMARFHQLWVRSGYTKYRDRFLEFHSGMCDQFPDDLKNINADHVINKSRIPENSWVQLFPVSDTTNQEYGSKFERYFPKVDANTKSIDLPPLVCFKLFCGKIPSTEPELDWAMDDVRRKFLDSIPQIRSYCNRIERSVRCHMNGDFAGAQKNNVATIARQRSSLDATYAHLRCLFPAIRPPLHLVAQEGGAELAAVLLFMNEDPNARDNADTPLDLAAQCGHADVAAHLLAAGADPNAVRKGGATPLHLASYKGHASTVTALIAGGANVNAVRVRGDTALHLAVQQGHRKVVVALLSAGADPNIRRLDGCTPLHTAALRDDAELSRLLLAHGADLRATLEDGRTPSHLAGRRWLAMLTRRSLIEPS